MSAKQAEASDIGATGGPVGGSVRVAAGAAARQPRIAGRLSRWAVPAALLLVVCLPVEAATLYRYINDKGYQEIGYSIPPHLVANGYDVIDDAGRLLRRVGPQMTEEEYARKLEQDRQLEACEKAIDQVHRRYEKLADIDAAERLFEEQLAETLNNDHANLEYSRSALAERQEQAATMERAGRQIPRHLLDNIERTELQIQRLTAQIEAREKGRAEKAREFDEERRIFQLADCSSDQLARAH